MLGRLAASGLLLVAAAAAAQDFPNRPVRIIVGFPPGGNVDLTARAVAPGLGDALGQQVVVENRGGAGGTVATLAVIKSPPDGYLLALGSSGTVTIAPNVYRSATYDPVRDMTAIGPIQMVPLVITAAAKTPVASYAELVALVKARNGQVSMASAGNGTSNHLAIELLRKLGNLDVLHVPYKGAGPALNDLLGSQVETMMDQLSASMPHIRDGRIKPLAVTSAKRSSFLPNVPTLAELGVTGYEASTFTGLFGPANMPQPVVDKLAQALRTALAQPAVRERYRAMGAEVLDWSRDEFAAYVRTDFEKWRAITRDGNITAE